MRQSEFDAMLATLAIVLVAAFLAVVWLHVPWFFVAIPLTILVIGIVGSVGWRRR